MARVELPQSRLRARRRRRRLLRIGVWCAAVAVVVGGLVALAYAPFVRISAVHVSGARSVATSTVEAAVRERLAGNYLLLFPRDNIFIYPNKEIAATLGKQFPIFKSVEVHADDFRTISVTVAEREPVAMWCGTGPNPGQCSYMDQDGVVYAPVLLADEPGFVTYLGQGQDTPVSDTAVQYLTQDEFHSLFALVGALAQSQPGDPVREVVVDTTKDVRVYFQNDFLLIFALSAAGGDVYERFTLALKADPFKSHKLEDFEYLDLRWGDKLYYKLRGS